MSCPSDVTYNTYVCVYVCVYAVLFLSCPSDVTYNSYICVCKPFLVCPCVCYILQLCMYVPVIFMCKCRGVHLFMVEVLVIENR